MKRKSIATNKRKSIPAPQTRSLVMSLAESWGLGNINETAIYQNGRTGTAPKRDIETMRKILEQGYRNVNDVWFQLCCSKGNERTDSEVSKLIADNEYIEVGDSSAGGKSLSVKGQSIIWRSDYWRFYKLRFDEYLLELDRRKEIWVYCRLKREIRNHLGVGSTSFIAWVMLTNNLINIVLPTPEEIKAKVANNGKKHAVIMTMKNAGVGALAGNGKYRHSHTFGQYVRSHHRTDIQDAH